MENLSVKAQGALAAICWAIRTIEDDNEKPKRERRTRSKSKQSRRGVEHIEATFFDGSRWMNHVKFQTYKTLDRLRRTTLFFWKHVNGGQQKKGMMMHCTISNKL